MADIALKDIQKADMVEEDMHLNEGVDMYCLDKKQNHVDLNNKID